MNGNFEKLANLVDEIRNSGEGVEGNAIIILDRGDSNSEMMFNLNGVRVETLGFIVGALSNLFNAVLNEFLENGFPPKLATKILYDAMAENFKKEE